jgi:hypothetical protein
VPAPSNEHDVVEKPKGAKIVLKHVPKEINVPSTSVKITSSRIKFLSCKA